MAFSLEDTDLKAQLTQMGFGLEEVREMRQQLTVAEQAVGRLHGMVARVEACLQPPAPAPVPTEAQVVAQERLIPVTDWPKFHSWPRVSSLRHFIFNARHNGFEPVIRRIGKRVLIRESAFFQWIDQHNGKSTQPGMPTPTARSLARKQGRLKV